MRLSIKLPSATRGLNYQLRVVVDGLLQQQQLTHAHLGLLLFPCLFVMSQSPCTPVRFTAQSSRQNRAIL